MRAKHENELAFLETWTETSGGGGVQCAGNALCRWYPMKVNAFDVHVYLSLALCYLDDARMEIIDNCSSM